MQKLSLYASVWIGRGGMSNPGGAHCVVFSSVLQQNHCVYIVREFLTLLEKDIRELPHT